MLNYRSYEASRNPQSHQGFVTDAIISELGQVAEKMNSHFTCGGKYEVPSSKPIELVYCQADHGSSKEWSSVEFPGISEADMIKLLDACSVGSYGDMGKDVVDKIYQNAFKLEPDNFLKSFQICATPILQEIQSFFSTVARLKAELYKLNIYTCGDFLKAHVDTVHSEKMFGSLVVCLPTQFTGGELMVRHNKQEIKYDWSSTASTTSSTLHWAAFFNYVEHEVLPVSEGYRVTLTYNLSYHSKASNLTLNVKKFSFYKLLQAALSNPVFMRDGGVLGFNSSHVFDTQWTDLLTSVNTIQDKATTIKQLDRIAPFDKFIQLSKDEQVKVLRDAGIEDVNSQPILDALPSDASALLKGADHIVVKSAKSLGLPVCVKPFLNNNRGREDKNFEYAFIKFSIRFGSCDIYSGFRLDPLQMLGNGHLICKAQDITWCQKLSYHQPAGVALQCRNQTNAYLWYKSTAILIRIPKWSQFRQRLIGISTGECFDITGAEDGMVKDFKDIIQEDALQGEIQELNKTIEALLDNQSITAVQGLVAVLKETQIKLNGCSSEQGRALLLSEQAEIIHDIKDDLEWLHYYAKDESIQSLHYTVEKLKYKYKSFHY